MIPLHILLLQSNNHVSYKSNFSDLAEPCANETRLWNIDRNVWYPNLHLKPSNITTSLRKVKKTTLHHATLQLQYAIALLGEPSPDNLPELSVTAERRSRSWAQPELDDVINVKRGVQCDTYVRSAKCNIQRGAFPNRATRERSAVGRLVRRGESYHARA